MAIQKQDGGLEQDSGSVDFVKAALRWQYNWIGLAGAAAFALVSGTGLPLVLAAGVELIYLAVVPQSSRFRRLVRSWQYAEEKRKHEWSLNALFQELPPEMRLRYADVDKVCQSIRQNYGRLSSTSQMFAQQMEDRLQGLAQSFLRLLFAAFQYRQYLHSTDPRAIKKDLDSLQAALASDPAKVQEINRKRIEILTKRLEKYGKAQENCKVVDAQCAAIEEVLQLIRDQSATLRDPQQLSDQLDSLVKDVDQTEQTVREVESIFDATELNVPLAPVPDEQPSSPLNIRNRLRN
jgi:uncharacterized protein YukE